MEVTLGLTLQSILDVDMDKGILTSLAWLNMEWKDPSLTWWNSDLKDVRRNCFGFEMLIFLMHFKIPNIRLPVSQIWSPDLEVYNGISQELTTRTDTAVITNC